MFVRRNIVSGFVSRESEMAHHRLCRDSKVSCSDNAQRENAVAWPAA
jgi:hypothetical protein